MHGIICIIAGVENARIGNCKERKIQRTEGMRYNRAGRYSYISVYFTLKALPIISSFARPKNVVLKLRQN